ncbi:MAG: hypothetical protein J6U01_06160 [Clostridia bacterium]|nr:hypothetical protein [Clostridia bacterium]
MSRLTDRISYLQGLAEGMKLNPGKDSHKLILGILDVLGDVGDAFDALAEAHGELNEYVESIDANLADLEAACCADADEAGKGRAPEAGVIQYVCPHCGGTVDVDPDDIDFDEEALCPLCGKALFPALPEEAEENLPEKEPESQPENKPDKKPEA